ncbi:MAG: hypothetical protein CBB71_02645 [Rhodopirellula sp. TMED11]|nr:MAG: hypothetical protein CBB71_02645 [Rhodopirellula sp. TMED11]
MPNRQTQPLPPGNEPRIRAYLRLFNEHVNHRASRSPKRNEHAGGRTAWHSMLGTEEQLLPLVHRRLTDQSMTQARRCGCFAGRLSGRTLKEREHQGNHRAPNIPWLASNSPRQENRVPGTETRPRGNQPRKLGQ